MDLADEKCKNNTLKEELAKLTTVTLPPTESLTSIIPPSEEAQKMIDLFGTQSPGEMKDGAQLHKHSCSKCS